MGLFSDKHYHSHDNSTHVRFPDTIKMEEHKAPTDESVRLLNEFQEKALDNLISKIEVKDNLVEGTVMAFHVGYTSAALREEVKIICKFKINGHEYVVEKGVSRDELWVNNADASITQINLALKDYAKSVMLWWVCKEFVAVAYKQITNQEPPKYALR
jgi:hypothetical protein